MTAVFTALKEVPTTMLVLHLPDFAKPFMVNYDASDTGFGAVLPQGVRPLCFYNKPFDKKVAAYERELISLV
jgi:hypothetical protein